MIELAMILILGAQDAEPRPAGLVVNRPEAFSGYTLFAPFRSALTYLIDMDGHVVHTWRSPYEGASNYLLEDGSLLRTADEPDVPVFHGGGQDGRIERLSWDGELIWSFKYSTEQYLNHHDIEPLENGNLLVIAWEYKSSEEALAAGRRPEYLSEEGFWPDKVIEIRPRGKDGADVVWEWHAWDHLIQDLDPSLANHGVVAEHPERIDVNGDRAKDEISAEQRKQLERLGYIDPAPDDRPAPRRSADWLHTNGISYDPSRDLIALSVRRFSEVWIIDHGTTTEEARGSSGGRAGRGGDLLYRWGNPVAWGRGDESDQQLFFQHDTRWIPDGFPGAGNLTIFNNGRRESAKGFSSVDEIELPLNADGSFVRDGDAAFGPSQPIWSYEDPDRFFSSFVSGAHRLPNGNTLICSGAKGRLFEVDSSGRIVWEYVNPFVAPWEDQDDAGPGESPNAMFRATRISPDHPGLRGRNLQPLDPQPQFEAPAAKYQ